MKRSLSTRVEPMSKKSIQEIAKQARGVFKLKDPYIDMEELVEMLIAMEVVVVCESGDKRLEGKYALTYPDRNLMLLSEDTYLGACNGNGRDRFTIAHEIGHLLMHKNQFAFARLTTGNHKVYEDAEWQADTFASHFLIDNEHLGNYPSSAITAELVSGVFGTSFQAASVYLQKNYH